MQVQVLINWNSLHTNVSYEFLFKIHIIFSFLTLFQTMMTLQVSEYQAFEKGEKAGKEATFENKQVLSLYFIIPTSNDPNKEAF